jgi:hypothetical protein
MDQAVLANDRAVAVGKDREGVSRFPRQVGRDLRRVDADRDRPDADSFEFGKLLLDAP